MYVPLQWNLPCNLSYPLHWLENEMFLPDALSKYASKSLDEIQLNLNIYHMYITPECKANIQA